VVRPEDIAEEARAHFMGLLPGFPTRDLLRCGEQQWDDGDPMVTRQTFYARLATLYAAEQGGHG
jgi:hypothetical protein